MVIGQHKTLITVDDDAASEIVRGCIPIIEVVGFAIGICPSVAITPNHDARDRRFGPRNRSLHGSFELAGIGQWIAGQRNSSSDKHPSAGSHCSEQERHVAILSGLLPPSSNGEYPPRGSEQTERNANDDPPRFARWRSIFSRNVLLAVRTPLSVFEDFSPAMGTRSGVLFFVVVDRGIVALGVILLPNPFFFPRHCLPIR
jgi:hypothetical protein